MEEEFGGLWGLKGGIMGMCVYVCVYVCADIFYFELQSKFVLNFKVIFVLNFKLSFFRKLKIYGIIFYHKFLLCQDFF